MPDITIVEGGDRTIVTANTDAARDWLLAKLGEPVGGVWEIKPGKLAWLLGEM